MKKLLLALVLLFTFTTSCDLINSLEDECDKVDEINTSTNYGVIVYDTNHSRINGIDVKLETWKVHCDGSIGTPNGNVITGVTGTGGSAVGFFGTPYRYGYTIKTKQDEIHFKATLSKNGAVIVVEDAVYDYTLLPPSSLIMKIYIDPKWGK